MILPTVDKTELLRNRAIDVKLLADRSYTSKSVNMVGREYLRLGVGHSLWTTLKMIPNDGVSQIGSADEAPCIAFSWLDCSHESSATLCVKSFGQKPGMGVVSQSSNWIRATG